jgi:sugar/nucleoside kinase (ribokinase family)
MSRLGIALAGNWIVDRVKKVNVYPGQDALANILAVEECNGGSPYNVAIDLVRLGVGFPLYALGLVGNDEAGRGIVRHVRRLGVDDAHLSCADEVGTSFTDVFSVGARRTFFHFRGANARFDGEKIDFSAVPARMLHLGYLLLLDAMDAPDETFGTVAGRFLARAQAEGIRTSVDLVSEEGNRFEDVVLPTLPHVDYLFANEFELERTTGLSIGSTPSAAVVAKAASTLFARGLGKVLFLHTPHVAFASLRSGEVITQPSVRVPESAIRGVVGAGDAFAAGALCTLHEGQDFALALRLGVCAAAACILDATTSGGLGSSEECLKLSESFGFNG